MTNDPFDLCDPLGPKTILHIYEPGVDLKAIVVVDNVAAGPAIGGVRMAADVSLDECYRLARAMTYKNAAAGLPHGGGKAVIAADPSMPVPAKERLIRAFACAISSIADYIPGPDMGTDETAMGWIHDETGRSVGLPREIGGIPLDEIGATGWGLSAATEVACDFAHMKLAGARVAIQGFGSVGTHAARFLGNKGAILVAASDSKGTIHHADGLDVEALIQLKHDCGQVSEFEAGIALDRDAIIGIDCDIWIPAARPDVIRADNVSEVKARLIIQGANIGVTSDAEYILHERGTLCVPDFISNAGGVICASVEHHGGSETHAMAVIEEKVRANTGKVLQWAARHNMLPRTAAIAMTRERIERANLLRRWHSS